MHMYTFTGLTNNTVYTVSVVAINCAGSSSSATITGRTGITTVLVNYGGRVKSCYVLIVLSVE